jgi:prepilin-type processing-associated H-X9-DG protein/prepilin-type N-terminal cleavage/methylation domain-containing protein
VEDVFPDGLAWTFRTLFGEIGSLSEGGVIVASACSQGPVLRRTAFTLVELLVVIAIIGTLVGLLLPAVQAARESARLATCANKINQLSKACLNYESARGTVPPAFTDQGFVNPTDVYLGNSGTTGLSYAMTAPWTVRILPFCDDMSRFNTFNQAAGSFGGDWGGYPAVNKTQAYTPNSAYQCPSHIRSLPTTPNTDYFGVSGGGLATAPPAGKKPSDGYQFCTGYYGNQSFFGNGAIIVNGSIRTKDFTDGTSKQFMLAETRYQFTLESEQAWAIATAGSFYVGRVSRPSWAGASRSNAFTGPHSTSGAAVNGINSSDFIDTSAAPASGCGTTTCGGEMSKTFGSYHPGGCNIAFADGSVQFVSQVIDINLYRRLGSRADRNTGGLAQ